jgi:ureidoglycolate amidohydrolase
MVRRDGQDASQLYLLQGRKPRATQPVEMRINIVQLQREINKLALISENSPPVVTRVLFSEADLRARRFIKKLCRDAGLILREDAAGNIFARWEGTQKNLPAVATGSHIDAIPHAGKYDGVVGVLGGIEAIRALKRSNFEPKRSIELIIFTSEEPTRFGLGCVGSRLLAGVLSPHKAATLRSEDGRFLGQWLKRAGFKGKLDSVRRRKNCYSAFTELHIEQGPVLEKESVSIGIVEKIAAPSTVRIQLAGAGGHAGATLMPGRRDALLAGAEIALAVETAVLASGSPDTVGTTGVFKIEPGAVNSIPCRTTLEIDLRDTNVTARNTTLAKIEKITRAICARRKIKLRFERLNVDPPAICDAALVQTVSLVCRQLNMSSKR